MPTATHHPSTNGFPFTDRRLDLRADRPAEWNVDGAGSRPGEIDGRRLARTLGLFAIGLGLARTLAPRGPARMAAIGAVVGVTVLDIVAGKRLSRSAIGPSAEPLRNPGIRVKKAITVNRSPEEAYTFWRNFEYLPWFMAHLESVRVMDQHRSYWKAKAPLGATIEWAAEIVEDRPPHLIAWRSLEGADVPNSGQVSFLPAPGGRGTEIRVELSYDPPGGIVGATIAKLFGKEPSQQVDGDLRRFKQMLEIGEVVHSDASIHRGRHPAHPPAGPPSAAATFPVPS